MSETPGAYEFRQQKVIPSFVDGGTWAACFGLSWADMLLYDQSGPEQMIRPGGTFFRKQAGTMGVAAGRSEIAAAFLKTDADWLFMVDADMGFAPDTVSRLVSSAIRNNVKVIGGLCFAQKIDPDLSQGPFQAVRYRITPTVYRYLELENGEKGFLPISKYRRDQFQIVAGTGAACILIHRDVLEAVGPDPFAPITDATAGGNGTSRTFSEDLSFCIRVQAAEFAIGVDTSIKTTHYKGGIYLDEVQYAMQQETLIQAKGHASAGELERKLRNSVSPLGLVVNQ